MILNFGMLTVKDGDLQSTHGIYDENISYNKDKDLNYDDDKFVVQLMI